MPNKHINIMLDPGAFMPEYAHSTDAGADLRSPVNITVPAHGSAVIDTGVHMLIPWHCAGMLKSKSGLNVKFNITSEGVIDPGYTGSIRAKLYNHGDKNFVVRRGDKITQIVIVPVYHGWFQVVPSFDKTERGDNGFGSTGR